MEFCAERDSPNKGGPALVPSRLCFCRFKKIARDDQTAQIHPDGNSAGSRRDSRCNADGAHIVEAQSGAGKGNIPPVA